MLNAAEDRLQVLVGRPASAAPGGRGEVLAFEEQGIAGRAMEVLAPALAAVFAGLGLSPRELAGIACVRGPGRFTGLRIVLSTALGLARSAGVGLAGLDYLPLLAAGPALADGSLWVLTHARQGQVYAQGFRPAAAAGEGAPGVAPDALTPALALAVEHVPRLLDGAPRPARLLGSGVRRHAAALAGACGQVDVLPPEFDAPSAEVLLEAAGRLCFGREPVVPLYLSLSAAEENLPALAALRGLTPAEALERLRRSRT